MVPAVDKKDTEQLLNGIREQVETVRQEILGWVLPKDQTTNDAEAQALRKLAARSAQQTRQWTGRMLKELDTVYPYPHSSDSSTDIIDKTSVPQTTGYDLPADFPVVRRIKHARMNLTAIKGELNTLLTQCIPGSFFNQCLFRVMENAVQTSMWLGELLHEFYAAQPKAEAVAPGKEPAPTPVTEPTSTGSGLGAESSPAAISPIMEAVLSNPYQTEIIKDLSLASTSTAKEDSTKPTEPSPTTPEPTESASAKAKTSDESVRK